MTVKKFKKLISERGLESMHVAPCGLKFSVMATWKNGETDVIKNYFGHYKSDKAIAQLARWALVYENHKSRKFDYLK